MEKITTADAAKLLQLQKGYAGYSLIKEDATVSGGEIGHAIFCPECGTEIAMVNVRFLPPQAPEPGSRMAILMDLARPAVTPAVAKNKPVSKPIGRIEVVN